MDRGDLPRPLFTSRKGNRLMQVLHAAGLNQGVGFGSDACHPTWAEGIYRSTGNDIVLTSRVLGYRSL